MRCVIEESNKIKIAAAKDTTAVCHRLNIKLQIAATFFYFQDSDKKAMDP